MRKMRLLFVGMIALSMLLSGFTVFAAETTSEKAAVIRLDQTIESGLQSYVERALSDAEESGADTAILVINTFGGTVDAAAGIGEAIRNSPLKTIAYVEGKAISAGSYIALNANEIYMQDGSSIGAAAVVTVGGERVTDSKTVGAWVGMMTGAAELNGRNEAIAEGMVDDSKVVELPEIGKTFGRGELISLSAEQALAVGYAEGIVESVDQLLSQIGAKQMEVIDPTPAEKLARVLTHPAVTTILFIVGIAGILIEMLVPGFGVPGIVGVAAFGLYFFGNYVAGFAGVEHLVLFVAGVVLLLLELFVPSFGILGFLGIAALLGGVVLAAYDTGNTWTSLAVALFVSAIIVAIVVKIFKHRGVWNKFILRDSMKTEEGYVSHDNKKELIGQVGRAITPLRPAGTALVKDQRIDVVTNGEFIAAGTSVEVVEIEGIRIVVREAPNP